MTSLRKMSATESSVVAILAWDLNFHLTKCMTSQINFMHPSTTELTPLGMNKLFWTTSSILDFLSTLKCETSEVDSHSALECDLIIVSNRYTKLKLEIKGLQSTTLTFLHTEHIDHSKYFI